MKIDIITRHAVANYGSILQAYATQKILQDLGYDTEIINYIRPDEYGKNISRTMLKRNKKWNSNAILRFIYLTLQTPIYNGSFNKFCEFRKRLLKETKLCSSDNELRNLPEADIYCTGSDQVWGPVGNVSYDNNYFLTFAPEEKKCVSLASSFGCDCLENKLLNDLPELLNKYSAITVRESVAEHILSGLGIKSRQLMDPTLLLSRADWEELCSENIKKRGYVLTYQLHDDKRLEKYAEEFAKRVGRPLIRISISWFYRFKSGNFVFMPTPEEFLAYFRNCDYVITDSFHATVFSILFNKKFVDILPKNTGKRITSLLEMLGLEERAVYNYADFEAGQNEINYSIVNEKLEQKRQDGLHILSVMLGEK